MWAPILQKYTRPSLLKSYIHYITYSVLGNAEEFYGTLCRQMIKLGFEDINLSYRVVCIYCKRGVLVMWVACKVLRSVRKKSALVKKYSKLETI